MKIKDIITLLNAKILCGEQNLEKELKSACGSDMMSDVLAYVKDQSVLLTGLINPQVVRTAEMMDMSCIVFVRGKQPDSSVIELANNKNITLLSTNCRLFTACGILFSNGLGGGECN
jgi:predicted transcriptional regulator